MHKKIKNLIKMWEKEGYEVKYYTEHIRSGDVLAEVELTIFRSDGHYIKFLEEWDAIKSLASRQGFYVMPVCENNNDGFSEVLLIIKDSAYQVHHQVTPIKKALDESYWYVQEDAEIVQLSEVVFRLYQMVYQVHYQVKRMKSMDSNHYDRKLFYNGQVVQKWDLYKELLENWSKTILSSNKVNQEIKEQAKRLTELYVFD